MEFVDYGHGTETVPPSHVQQESRLRKLQFHFARKLGETGIHRRAMLELPDNDRHIVERSLLYTWVSRLVYPPHIRHDIDIQSYQISFVCHEPEQPNQLQYISMPAAVVVNGDLDPMSCFEEDDGPAVIEAVQFIELEAYGLGRMPNLAPNCLSIIKQGAQ